MGSLVPGWEAETNGLPPVDLREFDETADDKPKGYFARLPSQRHSDGGEPHPPAMPHSATMPSHGLSMSPPGPGRMGSLSKTSAPLSKYSMHHQPHGPVVDWESELSSLRGAHSARYPIAEAKAAGVEVPHGWWERMDAGAMNEQHQEAVEEAHGPGKKHESFVPQYNPMRRVSETAEPAL